MIYKFYENFNFYTSTDISVLDIVNTIVNGIGMIFIPIVVILIGVRAYKKQKKIDLKSDLYKERINIYKELNQILVFLLDKESFSGKSLNYRDFFFKNHKNYTSYDMYNSIEDVLWVPKNFKDSATTSKTISLLYDFYKKHGLYFSESVNDKMFEIIKLLSCFYFLHNTFLIKTYSLITEGATNKNTIAIKRKKSVIEIESYHFAYYSLEKKLDILIVDLIDVIIEELNDSKFEVNIKTTKVKRFNIDEVEKYFEEDFNDKWFFDYCDLYKEFIKEKLTDKKVEKFYQFFEEYLKNFDILKSKIEKYYGDKEE